MVCTRFARDANSQACGSSLFHNLESTAGSALKASFGGALQHSISCPDLEVEVDGVSYNAGYV